MYSRVSVCVGMGFRKIPTQQKLTLHRKWKISSQLSATIVLRYNIKL